MKKLLCFLLILLIGPGIFSCKAARLEYFGISEAESSEGESLSDISDETPEESHTYEPSDITPCLWKVTSDEDEGIIWLFGSIHVADESAYPLPPAVMRAFDSSDCLAVEINRYDDAFDDFDFFEFMSYKDGSKIYEKIPAKLYRDSFKLLESFYSIDKQHLDSYLPIAWEMILNDIPMYLSGLSYEYGIDNFFMEQAYDAGKTILQLESIESQSEMLVSFSHDLQIMMLADIVYTDMQQAAESLLGLYEKWKTGELSELCFYSDLEEGMYTEYELVLIEEYNDAMITQRNIGMYETAVGYISDGLEVFYVVGAAHMLGEDGIVQLLINDGYTVVLIDTAQG